MKTGSSRIPNAEKAVTFWAGPLLNKGIPALTEPTVEINDTALHRRTSSTLSRASSLPRYQNCKGTFACLRVSRRTGILLLEVAFLGFFLQIPTLQRDQEEEVTKDTKNEGEEGECVVG